MAIWALCLMAMPSFAMAQSITSTVPIEIPTEKVVYETRQDGVGEKEQYFQLKGMNIVSNVALKDVSDEIDKIIDKYLSTDVTEKDISDIRKGIDKAYRRHGHKHVRTYVMRGEDDPNGYVKIRVFDTSKGDKDVFEELKVEPAEVVTHQNK